MKAWTRILRQGREGTRRPRHDILLPAPPPFSPAPRPPGSGAVEHSDPPGTSAPELRHLLPAEGPRSVAAGSCSFLSAFAVPSRKRGLAPGVVLRPLGTWCHPRRWPCGVSRVWILPHPPEGGCRSSSATSGAWSPCEKGAPSWPQQQQQREPWQQSRPLGSSHRFQPGPGALWAAVFPCQNTPKPSSAPGGELGHPLASVRPQVLGVARRIPGVLGRAVSVLHGSGFPGGRAGGAPGAALPLPKHPGLFMERGAS